MAKRFALTIGLVLTVAASTALASTNPFDAPWNGPTADYTGEVGFNVVKRQGVEKVKAVSFDSITADCGGKQVDLGDAIASDTVPPRGGVVSATGGFSILSARGQQDPKAFITFQGRVNLDRGDASGHIHLSGRWKGHGECDSSRVAWTAQKQ